MQHGKQRNQENVAMIWDITLVIIYQPIKTLQVDLIKCWIDI